MCFLRSYHVYCKYACGLVMPLHVSFEFYYRFEYIYIKSVIELKPGRDVQDIHNEYTIIIAM